MIPLSLVYNLGDGPKETVVSIRAQVAWEMRTKKKMGSFGTDGIGVTDLVGLLMEQLRVEGNLPAEVTTELALSGLLGNSLGMQVDGGPTEPGPPPGS